MPRRARLANRGFRQSPANSLTPFADLPNVPMAQSKAGRSVREANGPARSEPVQVRVQPVPMFRRRDRWWLAAVVVAAVLPYLDSLQGAFVYRPLTMVSYGLSALLSPNPLSYHLMNVALHALAALAAFSLARSLLRSTPAAGVAALLFAVHPVHTEPVANIAGRAEVLAGLFSLLALACFARATDAAAGKRLWFVASLAAFAAGLLSKESAFATIALVALVSMWIERAHLLTVVRRVLPYVALGVAFVALRWFAVGAITLAEPPPFIDNPLAHVGLLARLATALVVLGDYGSVLAVPLRLSADDSFNQVPVVHSLADPRLVGTTAVILALALALGAARRRMPVLPFAALFFVFAIALTSNVCFPIGTIKAERMLYLPSFSWCLACGWLLRRWTGRVDGRDLTGKRPCACQCRCGARTGRRPRLCLGSLPRGPRDLSRVRSGAGRPRPGLRASWSTTGRHPLVLRGHPTRPRKPRAVRPPG